MFLEKKKIIIQVVSFFHDNHEYVDTHKREKDFSFYLAVSVHNREKTYLCKKNCLGTNLWTSNS